MVINQNDKRRHSQVQEFIRVIEEAVRSVCNLPPEYVFKRPVISFAPRLWREVVTQVQGYFSLQITDNKLISDLSEMINGGTINIPYLAELLAQEKYGITD